MRKMFTKTALDYPYRKEDTEQIIRPDNIDNYRAI